MLGLSIHCTASIRQLNELKHRTGTGQQHAVMVSKMGYANAVAMVQPAQGTTAWHGMQYCNPYTSSSTGLGVERDVSLVQ